MVRASEQPELRQAPLPPPEPPKPKCDLIMKGGITSGIVYPPALFELQKHYQGLTPPTWATHLDKESPRCYTGKRKAKEQ